MVKIDETGFFADVFFELVDRARGIDGFNGAAVGADEVVAVLSGEEEGEVGGPFVEAKAADHAFVAEALEKAENGGFVTLFGEVSAGGEFGEGHGAVVVGETGEDGLEGFGTTKTGVFGVLKEGLMEGHF